MMLEIKVKVVWVLGGKVVLYGDAYDQAAAEVNKFLDKYGYIYIYLFDDIDVIVGQGIVGMEILWQYIGFFEVVFVLVGGGGLIVGVFMYIKYL